MAVGRQVTQGLATSPTAPGQYEPPEQHFGPETIWAVLEQHTRPGNAEQPTHGGTAQEQQTVPPRTLQRNTEPQAVKQGCCPHWFLPLLTRAYSTWSKGGTAAALPSLPCLLVSKLREPLTPTCHQHTFLTRWQEQGFACTELWHSNPAPRGGTHISWAHGTDL